MILHSLPAEVLCGIRTQEQLDLLNSIDKLRSRGINHYISLPQIIVCGDQSSGKSSVLEAISGVSFPIKSSLCTRFPTELVLRKSAQSGVSVSIVRHRSHNDTEQPESESFHKSLDGFQGLPVLIEDAKEAMGITAHGKAFSKDILRIEISGPDRPHLTIVDLPGLIHSETKQQSLSDVELIRDVVRSYMEERRSIILAVVSAKNDFANQIVLKLAREADLSGHRTLGVITKPDTLIPGSESERTFISLAMNHEVDFRLGWHILKNMDSEKERVSLERRDAEECQFFEQGVWSDVGKSIVGISQLRARLSKVLMAQIVTELPSLVNEIKVRAKFASRRFEKLGEPRSSLREQRAYLVNISHSFQSLVKAATDGAYSGSFFQKTASRYMRRLRAVVQNLNEDYADDMSCDGHYRIITTNPNKEAKPLQVTRQQFTNHVDRHLKKARGRELPGTFNPMVISDLFLEQCAPWDNITRKHVNRVWEAAKAFVSLAVQEIADETASKQLLRNIFDPALRQLLKDLHSKTDGVIAPHLEGHPITYNPSFEELYEKTRNERRKSEYATVIKSFFNIQDLSGGHSLGHRDDMNQLANHLQDIDLDDAPDTALDCMLAYYEVAMKRFIDDVAVEIVEEKLISKLAHIFSPMVVFEMPDRLVTDIAGESEENRDEREELNKQLNALNSGLAICEQFIGLGVSYHDLSLEQSTTSEDRCEYNEEMVYSASHFTESPNDTQVECEDKEIFAEARAPQMEVVEVAVDAVRARTKKKKSKVKRNTNNPLFA